MKNTNIILGSLIISMSLLSSSMVCAADGDMKKDSTKVHAKHLFIAHHVEAMNSKGDKEDILILRHVKSQSSKDEAKKLLMDKKLEGKMEPEKKM